MFEEVYKDKDHMFAKDIEKGSKLALVPFY